VDATPRMVLLWTEVCLKECVGCHLGVLNRLRSLPFIVSIFIGAEHEVHVHPFRFFDTIQVFSMV